MMYVRDRYHNRKKKAVPPMGRTAESVYMLNILFYSA